MWIGNSERNLHELFEQARRTGPACCSSTRWTPSAPAAPTCSQHAGRQLDQPVPRRDGRRQGLQRRRARSSAATNAPWHLDSRLPPARPVRPHPLRAAARRRRRAPPSCACSLPGKPVEDIDYEHVGQEDRRLLRRRPEGGGGRGRRGQAARGDARPACPSRSRPRTCSPPPRPLKPTTREWFATARNYALYSNQGGIYDDVRRFLEEDW